MASAVDCRLTTACRNPCLTSSAFQSSQTPRVAWHHGGCASSKPAASIRFMDHNSRRWHGQSEEHAMPRSRRSESLIQQEGFIGHQGKRHAINACRNEGVPASEAQDPVSPPVNTQTGKTVEEDQSASVLSEAVGQPKNVPEVDLALQQAQRQLDLFTQQLQEYAESGPSMLSSKDSLKPENLSSMGAGRGLRQAPPFPGGMGKGQIMPPELLEALEAAEGQETGGSLFPEDRYFEEVSKEELKELLYGDGREKEEDRRRASKKAAADSEDGGLEWEFGVPSESGGGFRKRSRRDESSEEIFNSSEQFREILASPKRQDGKTTRLGTDSTAKEPFESRPPLSMGTLPTGASIPPLPPPSVLQSRIPPAPAPSPNLLPISPLQRPSSWLSDSYPSAPRLPFNSGRPPVNGPTKTPSKPASTFKAPQPPIAPAPPISSRTDVGGVAAGGSDDQVPWPPLPPAPGLDAPFDRPGNAERNRTNTGVTKARAMPAEAQKLFNERTESSPRFSSTSSVSESFSTWPSDSDGLDRPPPANRPSFLDGVNTPPRASGPSFSDGPLDVTSQSVRLREAPQLQSDALRKIFAMSPEELRALDRQLATGEARIDLSTLGGQNAPSPPPPERTSAHQPLSVAAREGVTAPEAKGVGDDIRRAGDDVSRTGDDVGRLQLGPHVDKARTLDSIIDDLSSVTADGSFAAPDAVLDGQASATDLLERLKRLVDISEKAIGDLAFGGALPEGEEEDDNDASLPWYEEPGTCMDHEFYYGGGGGPREGTENVANLFADEELARERFSRPLPYGPFSTGSTSEAGSREAGTSGADVAARKFAEDADVHKGEPVTLALTGPNEVRQEGALSAEAAAMLRPEASVRTGSTASNSESSRSGGKSFGEADSSSGPSSEPVPGNEAGNLDADIESMAASLGLFQDAGPSSKVTTFEAPRARVRSEGRTADEPRAEIATGGGWVGQKTVKMSPGDGVRLEEAVKAAVSLHTGPEKLGKKGVFKERGLSKAFRERMGGIGNDDRPGPGKKGKIRRGGKENGTLATEAEKETGLRNVDEGSSEAAAAAVEKGPARDSAIGTVMFGDRKSGMGQRQVANPILRQAVAAVGNREEGTDVVSGPSQADGSLELETPAALAETLGSASESPQEASGEALRQDVGPSTLKNPSPESPNGEAVTDSSIDNQPSRDQSAAITVADAVSGSLDRPLNQDQSAVSSLELSDQAPSVAESGGSGENGGEASESKARTRKEQGFPDWMPKFFDKIHPDSPTFDPEAYANTHPIKRAMLENDSPELFPDFSELALRQSIPGLAKLTVPEPDPEFENPASNSVSKELNISAEQRRQVLDAANATTFDPAAYDKTAPPREAFRAFGTGSRDLDGWDVDRPMNLPEGEEEFEIPLKGGGTKRVKIPAGGFRNEQELIDAFGDLGTYPYMADSFDPVTDDDALEEVPPPDIPPEDAAMLTKVTTLSYSMRDYLGMDQDPTANFFKKGLVNSFVTFEDPLHCFTSATLLEDWFDLFTRNGYPPRLDFIWYECDPAHRWKRWVYTTLTVTLPKDLKHQLEAWGAHGWYEAEFGEGPEEPEPEPEPEGPEPDIMPEFRKVFKRAGLSPMKKKPKPLVLEMFSKFEMDESGKITAVFSKWDDFEEKHAQSSPRTLAKRRLFMAALLRKEWGR